MNGTVIFSMIMVINGSMTTLGTWNSGEECKAHAQDVIQQFGQANDTRVSVVCVPNRAPSAAELQGTMKDMMGMMRNMIREMPSATTK